MKKVTSFENQRSDRYCIIFDENELNLLKSPRYILQKIQNSDIPYVFIATILHDKDKREDDENSYKRPHYHMVIQFDGIYRIGTVINWFVDLFHINKNQITIEKCTSIEMQTRYLLHLDDPDKTQYDIWDISTSDSNILNRYLNLKIIKDLGNLILFVKEEHYDLEMIMSKIANYDKYRKYINDLIVNYYRKR